MPALVENANCNRKKEQATAEHQPLPALRGNIVREACSMPAAFGVVGSDSCPL